MVSKINVKLFITVVFLINNKRNFMVKYISQVHNFTVAPKYNSLFLHINLKLVPFAFNLLVSILVGILSSSESFAKYTLQNSLKINKLRH